MLAGWSPTLATTKRPMLQRLMGIALVVLISTTAAAQVRQAPEPELRQLLQHTVAQADSFEDRFDAEVWLLDMSTRMRRYMPDAQERLTFLLKAIQPSTRGRTGQPHFNGQIKNQRQIRPQGALDKIFQFSDARLGQATPATLIGIGGIGKTVTQDHCSTRQSRPYHLRQMLRARRKHQE